MQQKYTEEKLVDTVGLLTLTKRFKLKLDAKTLLLCQKALLIMNESKDPRHNLKHITNMLKYLILLINRAPDLLHKIRFDVLILSICWHDVWKVMNYSANPLRLFINDVLEGIASAFYFKKRAVSHKLDKRLIKNVIYSIRKHSTVQILPTIHLEAKILQDLDEIEFWDYKRINKNGVKSNFYKFPFLKILRKIYYQARSYRRLNLPELEVFFAKQKIESLGKI